jgi:23S rRNA (uracil1939-C5)-methyltransferase
MSESLEIEKLVYGGDGLGRLSSGEVIFVPWSVPGDQLAVEMLPEPRKPRLGIISQVERPSVDRITPACSVFGSCGGCQWQQMSLAAQRAWKRNIVQESLARIGKLPDVPVLEILGSDEWQYRNRVQWEVQQKEPGKPPTLGYVQAGSHAVIPFKECLIIPPELNALAAWLREAFQQNPEAAAELRRIEAMQNADGNMLLSFYGSVGTDFVEALVAAFPAITGIVTFHPERKAARPHALFGQPFITETVLGKSYRISAGGFFQVNRKATELLLKTLEAWMLLQPKSLLDLYSGVGLFALHFHDRAKRIVAIESADSAVEDARQNAALHGASHIQWRAGDAGRTLAAIQETFDTAILDPPRAGCRPDVLDWLNQHVKSQILYVSCNPATLARDLANLCGKGWNIQAVQPIDMFPQTYHVETVVHLTRVD